MIYVFDQFEVDIDRFELRREGQPVAVEPQVFSLLALLVENHERMVSRDEIVEKIWNGRVISDAALSSRVKSLRQTIGDDGKVQRLIRTVHGKGFRFVGDLKPAGGADATAEPGPAGNTISRPAIVVLPFLNLSGDSEQEYFADAITQDIIANLSKHRWLAVVARNTAFGFKGRSVDVRQIGRELGVSYVVEGSVRRWGDRIRVTAQLVDAVTGSQRWSDRYDGDLEDVFAVQDEITEKVVARLEPEIGAAERQKVAKSKRCDLAAWESFHLGVHHFFKFTAEDNLEAQRLLQRSRDLDPDFGEAHAWWAYAVILGMVYWDTDPSPELMDEALQATSNALEIDDQNAVFYALKARVQLARCEYDSALAENEMAISMNPTFAAAHCGLADSLAYEGRYEEAIKSFERAIELSPNDPQRWAFLTYGALAHIFKGDFQTAVRWADRACEIPNCQYWALAHKAVALAHLDRPDAAGKAVRLLLKDRPDFTIEFARQKLFYLKDREQVDTYMKGLERAGIPAS